MTITNLLTLIRGLPGNTEIYFAEPGCLDEYMSFSRIDIDQTIDDDDEVVRDVVFRFEGPDGN